MTSIKGPGHIASTISGSDLRIGIIKTRWNSKVIDALVDGALNKLDGLGVKKENIVLETVPGSYELPFAVSRLYAASQIQSSAHASSSGAVDLLLESSSSDAGNNQAVTAASTKPFDAIIAIGCLIKGETMHFEYISDAVSHALMKIQVDIGIPVIFGVLACLTDEQALARAGLTPTGHNHGEDWGEAAVEMGVKTKLWNQGQFN
ncbi:6,7-dimethyl-8-ribityllumazine synthase [Lipomyces japonicus]|uniref:6,7-dimethyl-8-ribityllumazine synthase n=1 Tax=Lipomyces japonicus TaxID=56871 RepID=UPI0034CD83B8